MSFKAKDIPKPKIGPINGDINMAPITTAVESAFNPIEATNTAKIKIHAGILRQKSITTHALGEVNIPMNN